MTQKSVSAMAMLATAMVSSGAAANDSVGYKLRAIVPVSCEVQFIPTGTGSVSAADVVRLGELKEYCNSTDGYKLEIRYTPNTLSGVILYLGNERIVLDGSGRAFIPGASGATIQTRQLSAEVGERGFDTREFHVAAIAN